MVHTIPLWADLLGIVALIGVNALILSVGRSIGFSAGCIRGAEAGAAVAEQTITELREALAHAVLQWEEAERRAESYRSFNSSTLTERDKWQTLYHTQSNEHGNAQALMMEGIFHMARRLEALGQKVQIPPVLEEIQEAFLTRHVKKEGVAGQLSANMGPDKLAAPGTASSAQAQAESEKPANAR